MEDSKLMERYLVTGMLPIDLFFRDNFCKSKSIMFAETAHQLAKDLLLHTPLFLSSSACPWSTLISLYGHGPKAYGQLLARASLGTLTVYGYLLVHERLLAAGKLCEFSYYFVILYIDTCTSMMHACMPVD